MNGLERIGALIQGEIPDKKPLIMLTSLYGAKLTGCPLEKYYSQPKEYVNGQLAAMELSQSDVVFTPFLLTGEAEAFGSYLKWLPNNPPNIKKPIIRSKSELHTLKMPLLQNQPRLMYMAEVTELLASHYKGKSFIAAPVTSPFDLPAMLMGIEGWLELMLFHEEEMYSLLELMEQFYLEWTALLVEKGADVLVIPSMFTNPTLVTPSIIQSRILPYMMKILEKSPCPVIFHHGGNPLTPFMKLISSLPNCLAYALDPKDDFETIRQIVGEKTVLMGNINGPTMKYLSKEQMREKLRQLKEDRKEDPYFIPATSSADIAYATPEIHISLMREVFDES